MGGLSQKEIDTLKAQVLPFFREREAILVTYLFGSALREKTFRDLDFAILCERTLARSKRRLRASCAGLRSWSAF